MTLSGTAGFALFFVIWFTYPKHVPQQEVLIEERLQLSIPDGWRFDEAIHAIAKIAQNPVVFDNFTKEQLSVLLPEINIDAANPIEAMRQINNYTNLLPDYVVINEGGMFKIQNKGV